METDQLRKLYNDGYAAAWQGGVVTNGKGSHDDAQAAGVETIAEHFGEREKAYSASVIQLTEERDSLRTRNGDLALQLRDEQLKHHAPPSALVAQRDAARQERNTAWKERDAWKKVAHDAGICTACALGDATLDNGTPGCTDCLNTGYVNGPPLDLPYDPTEAMLDAVYESVSGQGDNARNLIHKQLRAVYDLMKRAWIKEKAEGRVGLDASLRHKPPVNDEGFVSVDTCEQADRLLREAAQTHRDTYFASEAAQRVDGRRTSSLKAQEIVGKVYGLSPRKPAVVADAGPIPLPTYRGWDDIDNDAERMVAWVKDRFGVASYENPCERVDRLLEEAIEIHQAVYYQWNGQRTGLIRAQKMVGVVYVKPPSNDFAQEIGGVMTCALALAHRLGIKLQDAARDEIYRIERKNKEHFDARHQVKVDAGIAAQHDRPK